MVARVWEVLPPQRPTEMGNPRDGAPAPATVDTSHVAPVAGPVADTGSALGDTAELGKAEDGNGASRISAKNDAGPANDAPAKRTLLRIELGEDEVEALVRLARSRGRGADEFVADLVGSSARRPRCRTPVPRRARRCPGMGRTRAVSQRQPPARPRIPRMGAVARF